MVATGITPRVIANAEKVRFEITNTGVAHAFPTYAVPKVVLTAVLLDGDGSPRPETLRSRVIARQVNYDGKTWAEASDTRLLPGQSAGIEVPWNGSDRARVWLDVLPEDFYTTQLFPALMQILPPDGEAIKLVMQADIASRLTNFRLYDTEVRRATPN
jgi:hypothetical protein